MSCVSGIQLSETSCSLKPAACVAPSAFVRMLRWVSTTPLGSLVEPDENWMNAVWSGTQVGRRAGSRNVVERVDQERARLERTPGFWLAEGGGVRREAVAELLVGVEKRLPELLRDAQQLVLVLVADADGDRHRHDAAVEAGPVRVDELLVARHVQDQVVAGLRADALQVEQDAQGPAAQVCELERLLGAFALEVNDRAIAARAVVEHVGERLVLDHRCSDSHVNVAGRPQVDARLEGRPRGLWIGQLETGAPQN